MTTPSILNLEEPLRNLSYGIDCLRLLADGMETGSNEQRALLWATDGMCRDYDAARAWFDAEYESMRAAKGHGPHAVS